MTTAFQKIYLLVAVLHLASLLLVYDILSSVTKPLLMPVLILWYLSATRGHRSQLHYIMTGAFVFSWVGDVLLMKKDELFLLGGLGAFLITHLLYIGVFTKEVKEAGRDMILKRKPWLALPFIGLTAGMIILIFNHLEASMKLPVVVYALVITVMVIMAIARYGNVDYRSFQSVLLGAMLFMISDSLIALDRFYFKGHLWQADFFIMTLYISGQFLIAKGSAQAIR
ncbi:MAG: hypothetical protein KatS3mg031_1403 [Chitinophagales bacterium]|nr:MAG: hypothetical protein KatS3mg031_1403 [Chitinophagales bacterium]